MNNMFKFDKEKSKKIATGVARGVVSVTLPAYLAYMISPIWYHSNTVAGVYIFIESFAALLGLSTVINYAINVHKEDKNKEVPKAKVKGTDKDDICVETVGMENAKQYFKIVNR